MYNFNTVNISSSAPIGPLLVSQPPDTSSAPAGDPSPRTATYPEHPGLPPGLSPSSNQSVQTAARKLLAATSSDGNVFEAGPRRADQPRMRSSIACSRCRRSKVKCVNNGVNTTCKDCEAKGRECTYPTPIAGGGGGVPRRDSGSVAKPLTEAAPTGEVSY